MAVRQEERRDEEKGGGVWGVQPFYLNHKHSFESVSLIMRKGRFRDVEANSDGRRGPGNRKSDRHPDSKETHKHKQISL